MEKISAILCVGLQQNQFLSHMCRKIVPVIEMPDTLHEDIEMKHTVHSSTTTTVPTKELDAMIEGGYNIEMSQLGYGMQDLWLTRCASTRTTDHPMLPLTHVGHQRDATSVWLD